MFIFPSKCLTCQGQAGLMLMVFWLLDVLQVSCASDQQDASHATSSPVHFAEVSISISVSILLISHPSSIQNGFQKLPLPSCRCVLWTPVEMFCMLWSGLKGVLSWIMRTANAVFDIITTFTKSCSHYQGNNVQRLWMGASSRYLRYISCHYIILL
jgi:hypothetical protein